LTGGGSLKFALTPHIKRSIDYYVPQLRYEPRAPLDVGMRASAC